MDLTAFRIQNPGLYQQAVEAGAEAERDRCAGLALLAEAGGVSPSTLRSDVERGATVAEAAPRYRRVASNSDATSAAFVRACARLGIADPVERIHVAINDAKSTPRHPGESEHAFAKRVLATSREQPTHDGANLLDLFARDLPPARPRTPEEEPLR